MQVNILLEVQKELTSISKTGSFQDKWQYVELSEILNKIKPILLKHNHSYSFDLLEYDVNIEGATDSQGRDTYYACAKCLIECRVYNETREVVLKGRGFGFAIQTKNDKVGGAQTYGKKYSILNTFGLSTEDADDPDAHESSTNAAPKSNGGKKRFGKQTNEFVAS